NRLSNDRYLLGILLTEERDVGLHDVEELDANGGDAVEVAGSELAFKAERDSLCNQRRRVAWRIHLFDRRNEEGVDARRSPDVGIARLVTRIPSKVGGIVELAGVHEDRRDDVIAGAPRGPEERDVSVVKGAHGRNQSNRPVSAHAIKLLAQIRNGAERLHMFSTPPR